MIEDWKNGGFGVYIHWPFCMAKCPYCDFNSHVVNFVDQKRWAAAYVSEIERIGAQTKGRIVETVFFGGGTPSLMQPETVNEIISQIKKTWPMVNNPEITLEANPTSVEAGKFSAFRQAGINRLSMGIQALNDTDLRLLGRMHSVDQALAAFDIACNTFDRISFDLIYARQHQTPENWAQELKTALNFAIDHLSLYQLTIEDGTAFADRYAIGKLGGLPSDDSAADMYDLTQTVCENAGFPGYEISNHARPGSESRHNKIYWNYGDYVGIGPGAHGRLTINSLKYATECLRLPNDWLNAVELQGSGELSRVLLNLAEQRDEFLLMGLRLAEGICKDRLTFYTSDSLNVKIDELKNHGFLMETADKITLVPSARPLLNAVLKELLI